jgi:hypothetical protein
MSGPLPDILMDKPVLIVYGTQQGNDAAAGNVLADRALRIFLSQPQGPSSMMHYGPFERKADVDVTVADVQNKHLILIGRPEQNSLVAQMQSQLPLTFPAANQVRIKNKTYTHADLRWAVIYPNPQNPENYVMMVNETPYINGTLPLNNFYQNDFLVFRPSNATSPYFTMLGKGMFTADWQ